MNSMKRQKDMTPEDEHPQLYSQEGEALYHQQKLDLELTVARIMSSLLQNWSLN